MRGSPIFGILALCTGLGLGAGCAGHTSHGVGRDLPWRYEIIAYAGCFENVSRFGLPLEARVSVDTALHGVVTPADDEQSLLLFYPGGAFRYGADLRQGDSLYSLWTPDRESFNIRTETHVTPEGPRYFIFRVFAPSARALQRKGKPIPPDESQRLIDQRLIEEIHGLVPAYERQRQDYLHDRIAFYANPAQYRRDRMSDLLRDALRLERDHPLPVGADVDRVIDAWQKKGSYPAAVKPYRALIDNFMNTRFWVPAPTPGRWVRDQTAPCLGISSPAVQTELQKARQTLADEKDPDSIPQDDPAFKRL